MYKNETPKQLLSIEADAKTSKNTAFGYLTGILYLAPHKISGTNVCPWSTKGCRSVCLYSAGRGRFDNVKQARIRRTKLFINDKPKFLEILDKDIQRLKRRAYRLDLKPAVRLNGTSDIRWELGSLIKSYPDVQFYGYTKGLMRIGAIDRLIRPYTNNYYLTYSRTEDNETDCIKALDKGINVAVVFRTKLPKQYLGVTVLDGDKHDLRFLDEPGCIVGLVAKGQAKKDTTGFVVDC